MLYTLGGMHDIANMLILFVYFAVSQLGEMN